MQRRVGAECERLLQVRRREGVVDDDACCRARARTCAVAAMSTIDSNGFVGVSIQTRPRLRLPRGLERGRVAQVARRPRDAVAFVHARNQAERAAVGVVRDDHVIARVECAQYRVLGREATRKRESVARTFERRDARFQRGARGVAAARVLVAAVLPTASWAKVVGETDRRDDRTRMRLGILARVDRAGLEPVACGLMPACGPRGSRVRRNGSARRSGDRRRARVPTVPHRDTRRRGRRASPIPIIGIGGSMISAIG